MISNASSAGQYVPYCDLAPGPFYQGQQQENEGNVNRNKILANIESMKKILKDIDPEIRQYRNDQEVLLGEWATLQARLNSIQNAQPISFQDQQLAQNLMQVQNILQQKKQKFLTAFQNIEAMIRDTLVQIKTEISRWKVMQQRSLSGCPMEPGLLDEIQIWFEPSIDAVMHFNGLMKFYDVFDESREDGSVIGELLKRINSHFISLMGESIVIEQQPPQVLKTQTRFEASIRSLLGEKMNYLEVNVSILSENQCKELEGGKKLENVGENVGEIMNGKNQMTRNPNGTFFHAEFRNLKLKGIKRQDRRGQESVLEAKSALVFSVKVSNLLDGSPLTLAFVSVPVVVVVHGNQGPTSEATIIWDNMFAELGRQPFVVPESVSWKEIAVALNAKCSMMTGRGLSNDDLSFLKMKLSMNVENGLEDPNAKISWSAFCKEQLGESKKFSFWEWYYRAIDIVHRYLNNEWKENCLHFISRQKTEKGLLVKPAGTFLIRFSESVPGTVSIAWCTEENGTKEVQMLEPWGSKDFAMRGLADRILDPPELKYLYPDIPKELVFAKLRSPEVPVHSTPTGYVRADLFTRILPPTSNYAMSEVSSEMLEQAMDAINLDLLSLPALLDDNVESSAMVNDQVENDGMIDN